MNRSRWIAIMLFAVSTAAGWAGSATAAECLYPYVTKLAELELVEVTRDGEAVEELNAYRTGRGQYGMRGYAFGIQVFYDGDGDDGMTFRRSFAAQE